MVQELLTAPDDIVRDDANVVLLEQSVRDVTGAVRNDLDHKTSLQNKCQTCSLQRFI